MRKLAVFSFAFAFSILLSQYIISTGHTIWFGTGFLVLGLLSLLISFEKVLYVRFITLGLAFGFLWNYFYGFMFSPDKYLDTIPESLTLRAAAYPQTDETRQSLEVRIIRDGIPELKATLYIFDQTNTQFYFKPGDIISVKAKLNIYKAEDAAFSARGTTISLYTSEIPEKTGEDTRWFRYLHLRLSYALKSMIYKLCPSDAAPFIEALITGDKNELYSDQYTVSVFSATGSAHVVAVSGMHLAFLISMLRFLFGKSKKASIVCIPVILFFMAMTGFSPSIVRAGIMQIMLLTAPLISRDYDNYTALGTALLILLILNPASARSASLQLSFASVFGIFMFSGNLNEYFLLPFKKNKNARLVKFYKIKPIKRILHFIVSSFSVSLAAISFTTPVAALVFGSVSLVSPFSNLCILWAVSLAFPLGLVSALLGLIFAPLGVVPGFAAAFLARYIMLVLRLFEKIPFAALYTRNILITAWLIYVYLTLLILIFTPKFKKKPLVFSVTALASLILVFGVTYAGINQKAAIIAALDVGQGQSVAFYSKRSAVVVDCGGNRNSGLNAAEYFLSMGIRKLDALVLTHFHSDHANGSMTLMQKLDTKKLIVPALADTDGLPDEILDFARSNGIMIIYIDDVLSYTFGEMELTFYPPLGNKTDNELGLSVLCTAAGFNTLITGDMRSETELRLLEYAESMGKLPDIDLYLAGHHGSKYSSAKWLLDAINPEIVFISVGSNSYGHPSDEALARFNSAGAAVYRTDLQGELKLIVNSP